MITETVTEPTTTPPAGLGGYLLKLLSGPAAFALVYAMAVPLSYQGHVALATFTWAVVWWITEPIPWAVSAMLPFVVFPALGVMDIAATMRLYGQPIFFWILGTVLVGYAIEKHGLAHRVALGFLSLPGVGGKTNRLMFAYMLIVGVISMFVSDAATIAMMIPIGMSVVRHVRTMVGSTQATPNFAAFITLGTFYASIAGGTATVMGVPHNAISMAALNRLTGRQLGFFEWTAVGVPVFFIMLVVFYLVLWTMARPEFSEVPSGEAFLRAERAKLGPVRSNERRVMFVFFVMVVLFTFPSFAAMGLGNRHEVAVWANRALNVWVIPPAMMLLLFIMRSSDRNESLVTWKDAERQAPWNAMLLVTGAVAMTDALVQFGFVGFMENIVRNLGIVPSMLPYIVATVVAITTNFISGTAAAALYCSIFIPAATEIGYNPASIAILIANVALGMVFPWAGATAATTFTGGEIEMRRMMRIGIVATIAFVLIAATIHLMMSGLI
jgi:solute carrier family 13 (sodium-dependent dicarboxylate transporter), member 2/3/5